MTEVAFKKKMKTSINEEDSEIIDTINLFEQRDLIFREIVDVKRYILMLRYTNYEDDKDEFFTKANICLNNVLHALLQKKFDGTPAKE